MSGRLARARALLQHRLIRRGVTLTAALSAIALQPEVSLPAPLMAATTRAAVTFASSKTIPAGIASTKVLTVANAALRSMFLAKVKSAVGALLLAGALVGGGAFAYQGANEISRGIRSAVNDEAIDRDREAGRKDKPAAQQTKKGRDPDKPQKSWNKIAAAWKRAGARVGWMNPDHESVLWRFEEEKEGRKGELPAFEFQLDRNEKEYKLAALPEDKLAILPAPEEAFGLSLSCLELTDDGLEKLARFKHLQVLSLRAVVHLTGTGLKKLTSLRGLELGLWSSLTDATLKDLAELNDLQTLTIIAPDPSYAKVTDDGVKALGKLKNLHALVLACSKVSDAGVKHLAELKALRTLSLMGTQVTEAGLKPLAGLKHLRTLDIEHTQVTAAARQRLQKTFPDCRIILPYVWEKRR